MILFIKTAKINANFLFSFIDKLLNDKRDLLNCIEADKWKEKQLNEIRLENLTLKNQVTLRPEKIKLN